jgi:GntP family gluconate:H+ symporter
LLLIALRSLLTLAGAGGGPVFSVADFLGEPITALLIGVFAALSLVRNWTEEVLDGWLGKALATAGMIVVITAAGGAFGNVLRISPLGAHLGSTLSRLQLGLLLPFALAATLKISQGSSTVAIITAASLVAPLAPSLGLAAGWGPTLTVLAAGAGGMIASHANDSYFWVVTRFSGLDVPTAYRVHTAGTAVEGAVTMAGVWLVSLVLV